MPPRLRESPDPKKYVDTFTSVWFYTLIPVLVLILKYATVSL